MWPADGSFGRAAEHPAVIRRTVGTTLRGSNLGPILSLQKTFILTSIKNPIWIFKLKTYDLTLFADLKEASISSHDRVSFISPDFPAWSRLRGRGSIPPLLPLQLPLLLGDHVITAVPRGELPMDAGNCEVVAFPVLSCKTIDRPRDVLVSLIPCET